MSTIILKIGGSLITKKESNRPEINEETLERITREIGEAYQQIKSEYKLIIIHGAGSYGHVIVNKTGIHKGISKNDNEKLLAFAETQRLQNLLNVSVVEKLIENNVPAFPIQSSNSCIVEKGKIINYDTEAIERMLEMGLVPVAFGVPAVDIVQNCSILSGDEIASFFAKKLGASRVIHATDVDGVFDSDPNLNKGAKLIEKITPNNFEDIRAVISGSTKTDVTGGMLNKVEKIVSLSEFGIKSFIINGNKEFVIKDALLGKTVKGTVISS